MNNDFNQLMQRYNFAEGGEVSYPVMPAQMGDQMGDQVSSLSGMADNYGLNDMSSPDSQAIASLMGASAGQMQPQMMQQSAPQAMPQSPQMGGRSMPPGLSDMLGQYQGEGTYGPELREARQTASRENDAFNSMLQDAISKKTDNVPSKSEMYFRLASAFGAPTKTGRFSESLGNASGVLGDFARDTRMGETEGKAGRLSLGIEAQKLKMAGSKDDLRTLQALAGEEMKDKRAIAAKMFELNMQSGKAQSTFGKQAMDEGFTPGTKDFTGRVGKLAAEESAKLSAQTNATLAGMSAANTSASLASQKFMLEKDKASKLSGPEVKLKTDTEDLVNQTGQALANLRSAYKLNPNTFDASMVDKVQRYALESSGSKSPKIQNTREMENLLEKAALSSLKATFPGAISDGERQTLMATQGLGAKSVKERGKIMLNAFDALQKVESRAKNRLNRINSGEYRNTESSGGIE